MSQSLARLRDGGARWTDAVALRKAMLGASGVASPGARLAAARLARGAARRDRSGDREGSLYGLIASGYVLGHCLLGPGSQGGDGSEAAAAAVRLLKALEQVGLSSLVAAAGPAATALATELVESSRPSSPKERRRAAWAVAVGIGLATEEGTVPEGGDDLMSVLSAMFGFPDPYGPPPQNIDLNFDDLPSTEDVVPIVGDSSPETDDVGMFGADGSYHVQTSDPAPPPPPDPPPPPATDDVIPIAGDGVSDETQSPADAPAPQPPESPQPPQGSDPLYSAVHDAVGSIVDLDAPPQLFGAPPGFVDVLIAWVKSAPPWAVPARARARGRDRRISDRLRRVVVERLIHGRLDVHDALRRLPRPRLRLRRRQRPPRSQLQPLRPGPMSRSAWASVR